MSCTEDTVGLTYRPVQFTRLPRRRQGPSRWKPAPRRKPSPQRCGRLLRVRLRALRLLEPRLVRELVLARLGVTLGVSMTRACAGIEEGRLTKKSYR